jgi:hypothetical protein
MRCVNCRSTDLRWSSVRLWEWPLRMLSIRPYRCLACWHHDFSFPRGLQFRVKLRLPAEPPPPAEVPEQAPALAAARSSLLSLSIFESSSVPAKPAADSNRVPRSGVLKPSEAPQPVTARRDAPRRDAERQRDAGPDAGRTAAAAAGAGSSASSSVQPTPSAQSTFVQSTFSDFIFPGTPPPEPGTASPENASSLHDAPE